MGRKPQTSRLFKVVAHEIFHPNAGSDLQYHGHRAPYYCQCMQGGQYHPQDLPCLEEAETGLCSRITAGGAEPVRSTQAAHQSAATGAGSDKGAGSAQRPEKDMAQITHFPQIPVLSWPSHHFCNRQPSNDLLPLFASIQGTTDHSSWTDFSESGHFWTLLAIFRSFLQVEQHSDCL